MAKERQRCIKHRGGGGAANGKSKTSPKQESIWCTAVGSEM